MTTGAEDLHEPAPGTMRAEPSPIAPPAGPKAPAGLGAGDIFTAVMVIVLGVVGLILGVGAVDNEMEIFGLSLFGFAVVFIIGLVRGLVRRQPRVAASGGSRHV